jgi:hypothetical protein
MSRGIEIDSSSLFSVQGNCSGSIRVAVGADLLGFTGTGDSLFTTSFQGMIAHLTPIDMEGNTHVANVWGVGIATPAGQIVWSTQDNGYPSLYVIIDVAPALAADGVLVVRDEEGPLRGFYNGKAVWSAVTGVGPGVSVIIGPDATIYAAAGATLYALR